MVRLTKQPTPDTAWDCHICLHWGGFGAQWGGIYGSPMECLGTEKSTLNQTSQRKSDMI